MKQRDFHKLAILRGEARGYTSSVLSKKNSRKDTWSTPKNIQKIDKDRKNDKDIKSNICL